MALINVGGVSRATKAGSEVIPHSHHPNQPTILERFVLKLLVLLVKLEGGLSTKLPVGQLVLVAVSLLVVEAATLSDGAKG